MITITITEQAQTRIKSSNAEGRSSCCYAFRLSLLVLFLLLVLLLLLHASSRIIADHADIACHGCIPRCLALLLVLLGLLLVVESYGGEVARGINLHGVSIERSYVRFPIFRRVCGC